MLGDGGQRGAVILRDIAVGADVAEQRVHRRAGQVDAVARLHIAGLGVAGGAVLEGLGAVQKLPALFLAHLHESLVEFVYLCLGKALVGMLLADRRDCVDDDVRAGVGGDDRLNAGLVVFDEIGGLVAGVQIVRAEGQDDPAGLQLGHGLRHRQVAGPGAELYAGKARKRFGAHADRADGVVIAAVIEHPVHAGRVAVPQKEGLVYVAFAGIGALLQNGRGVGLRVDGVFLFVVAAFGHHGFAVHGRNALRGGAAERQPADERQRNADADQQHHTAQGQHQIHFAAHIQRLLFFRFGFSCHVVGPFAVKHSVCCKTYKLILHHFAAERQSFCNFYII